MRIVSILFKLWWLLQVARPQFFLRRNQTSFEPIARRRARIDERLVSLSHQHRGVGSMTNNQLSLILLPTNKCNVACEYCFEDKTADFMTHEQLAIAIDKVLAHMEKENIARMTIYWQGGEVMIMKPEWFERAYELISEAAAKRGKHIGHSL